MKKVGIVGGIGPESTISYYHDIVYGVQERIGHPVYPPVSIESIALFEWVRLCDQKEMETLISFTVEAVGRLAASGCDFAILAANTAHLSFDEVQEKSPIPLLSIVEACAEEAKRRGYQKVGLLGTKFTMQNDFFKKAFTNRGIQVITPQEADQEYISDKIYSDLVNEVVEPEVSVRFHQIARQMQERDGIEALVLGCTELPLVFGEEEETSLPYLNTLKIHVESIVQEIVQE